MENFTRMLWSFTRELRALASTRAPRPHRTSTTRPPLRHRSFRHATDATDFEFADGAASTVSKLPGMTDIRSGGPGQTTLALVAHPLFSEGHLITGVTVEFQYVSGYGCSTPATCTNAANVSLAIVDAFNHSVIETV